MPVIDLESALAEFNPLDDLEPVAKPVPAPRPAPVAARPNAPAAAAPLAPPFPANDRDMQLATERLRDRQITLGSPGERPRRSDVPQSKAAEERPANGASRVTIAPPVARTRPAPRRDAANSNQGMHFGTGSRREVQERSSSRWIILAVLGAASLLCIGIGGYVWLSAAAPRTGAIEGRVSVPVSAPAPVAVVPAPIAVAPAVPAAPTP